MMKENRMQASTKDTLRVVKESIHDSMYESSKTLVKQLDKIGDKLTNVVEDFQKKQQTRNSRDRDRNRSNSRDRNNSRDNYRNRSWERRDNRDRYRNRSGDRRDSRDNSRDRDRGRGRDSLIPEKEEEINLDLDQVKDTLTEMISATTVTEQVMLHIGASDLKTI